MTNIGIVVIGRNEGERLVKCLESIMIDAEIIYVDSGSTDDSVAVARAHDTEIVELDMTHPFTAARARNAGRRALSQASAFIQFIDGDCTLQPHWLQTASAALRADESLAAVFGRRREVAPERSRYNWMCDLEWAHLPGPSLYFGGDVMLRASALDAVGGYPDEMIAGEEPDLAIRLRKAGWTILCVPEEMTLHDAAIVRFGQWWRRTIRSGHAYAELAMRHGPNYSDYGRRTLSVVFFGGALPMAALAVISLSLASSNVIISVAASVIFCLPVFQLVRLTIREI